MSTSNPTAPALARYPGLAGRSVFVTGGGSGIGAAIVSAFAEQGARVAFVDVAAQASEALVAQVAAAGHHRPCWQACDVRDTAALQAAIASAAATLRRHRIRINTVTPGWVMTERQKALWLTPEGEAEIERNQCLPERVLPEDIAAMVLFLASDAARMCTAQEFTVDGGWR